MDDNRIKGLTEGAGREESRINQDFIDFLSKWSTPFLVVLALLAVGYWGFNQYKAMKVAKINEATAAYVQAIAGETVLPVRLEEIGKKYEGIRSIGLMANLDAADLHLQAVQRGLEPGVQFLGVESLGVGDTLDDARRTTHLNEAERLYKSVLADARGIKAKAQIAVEAAFGLAAVAESRGNIDAAKGYLTDAEKLATKGGFARLAEAAKEKAAAMTDAAEPPLVEASALPALPEITPPPAPAQPDVPVSTTPSVLDNPPLLLQPTGPADDGTQTPQPETDDGTGGVDGGTSPDEPTPAPTPEADDGGTGGG